MSPLFSSELGYYFESSRIRSTGGRPVPAAVFVPRGAARCPVPPFGSDGANGGVGDLSPEPFEGSGKTNYGPVPNYAEKIKREGAAATPPPRSRGGRGPAGAAGLARRLRAEKVPLRSLAGRCRCRFGTHTPLHFISPLDPVARNAFCRADTHGPAARQPGKPRVKRLANFAPLLRAGWATPKATAGRGRGPCRGWRTGSRGAGRPNCAARSLQTE